METSLSKRPLRKLRSLSPFRGSSLDRFFRSDFPDIWDGGDTFTETVPSVNIREEKDNYFVDMAAPGLKKEDFDISVEGNLLTISCDKEEKKDEEAEGYSRKEYSYSCFSRSVTLPDYADSDRIAAKYIDGVLTLRIPKKPESVKSKSKKIKVD